MSRIEGVELNISGQKVRGFISDYMMAGVHSVAWDGRDDNGISLSSGVYVSRVSVGELISSRTMMLVPKGSKIS